MNKGSRFWPVYAPTRTGGYVILGIAGGAVLLFLVNLVMLVLAVVPMGVFYAILPQIPDNEELWVIWMLMTAGLAGGTVLSILSMIGVGGGLFWWGLRTLRRAKQLDEGAVTSGVIIDRWRRPRGGGGLTYRFTPWETGEEIAVTQYNGRAYHRYQVGDAVQVRYLADNPPICRLEMPEA